MSNEYSGATVVPSSLRGFRFWTVDCAELEIYSMNGELWTGEAKCKVISRHLNLTLPPHMDYSPDPSCTCGIYARHDPNDLFDLVTRIDAGTLIIAGSILASGRIELGTRGFRAEHAKIEAISPMLGLDQTISFESRMAAMWKGSPIYYGDRRKYLASDVLGNLSRGWGLPLYESMRLLSRNYPAQDTSALLEESQKQQERIKQQIECMAYAQSITSGSFENILKNLGM